MRVAIIDLGTNTCNLLVAQTDLEEYSILHQSKELVRLGDNKIRQNEISKEATLRVIDSFEKHKRIIRDYGVEKLRIIATSAIRTAGNKVNFLEELGDKTGCLVKVVSGEREAELIFKGVLLAFGAFEQPTMILDIGGGSNEIIITSGMEMRWSESRPTGMARIINRFHLSDPILPEEITMLKEYFTGEHKKAIGQCRREKVHTMVGCSGAFDTIADMIDEVDPGEKKRITQEITIENFYDVYQRLLPLSHKERLEMKGMDMVRVDLIVPALIFIEQLISATGVRKIIQTDYALREGVLYDMLQKNVR